MFGKLLKNDIKAQWHSMSFVFLGIIIITGVAEIFTLTTKNKVGAALGGLLVFLVLLFACFFIVLKTASMFSKTMFGRAGYLTLTLPVKSSTLLRSKTVSSLIWIFGVYALCFGSLFLWMAQFQEALGEGFVSSAESLLSIFGVPSFLTISFGVVYLIASLAVVVLVMVEAMQLAVTCSHVSPISKLGKFGAIIIFFVVTAFVMYVSDAVGELIKLGLVVTPERIILSSNIVEASRTAGHDSLAICVSGDLYSLACAFVLHLPTAYLIKNKVNIM
jgi:hypothetical protein